MALVAVTAVVVVAAVAVATILFTRYNAISREADKALEEEAAFLPDSLLLGNYDIRFEYPDSVARFVGIVDRDLSGNCTLTILSEYAPKILMLSFYADGSAECGELGSGKVTYRESLDKVTIRFEKEDYICTLVK